MIFDTLDWLADRTNEVFTVFVFFLVSVSIFIAMAMIGFYLFAMWGLLLGELVFVSFLLVAMYFENL